MSDTNGLWLGFLATLAMGLLVDVHAQTTTELQRRLDQSLDYQAKRELETKRLRSSNAVLNSRIQKGNIVALPDLWADAGTMTPTNNVVKTTRGTGEVAALDPEGLMIRTNGSYTPRIPLTELCEEDFRALLQTKKAYDALSAFRYGQTRTAS